MVSYCSLSNDRLLTKILIENSNNILLSKCVHDFVNKCQWIDGLDIWSSSSNNKNEILKTNLDFDKDIGLYLPRYYQFNSTTFNKNNSKQINKDKISSSLQKLIQREDNQFSSINNQTTDIIQKQNSNENVSNKIVLPIRQSESRNCFEDKKCKDKIEYLLKEELTNLFRRESTNICSKRSFIRIPSVDIKHNKNNLLKSNSSIDSTLIMERYTKLKQLLINQKMNSKSNDLRQSPSTFIFQPLSTFGLTVTPLDFSSTKQLQNTSFQQKETINRPVTQPGFVSSSTEKVDHQEQRIFLRRNNDMDFVSSYTDLTISNKNPNDEQIQTIKRSSRHHRFLSKSTIQRSKTMQFLPHIAGTKINIDFINFVQFKLDHKEKQRPIKRQIVSSYGSFDSWCPFLKDWFKTSKGKQAWLQLSLCIEACVQGIIKEGYEHDSNTEAVYIPDKFRRYSRRSRREATILSMYLYTKDSFLYHAFNTVLRQCDLSKLDTLGPFAFLISNYSHTDEEFVGTVYREVKFTSSEIETYKQDIGTWKTCPAYFIIEITDIKLSAPYSFHISTISHYPVEEEVLLPSGMPF